MKEIDRIRAYVGSNRCNCDRCTLHKTDVKTLLARIDELEKTLQDIIDEVETYRSEHHIE